MDLVDLYPYNKSIPSAIEPLGELVSVSLKLLTLIYLQAVISFWDVLPICDTVSFVVEWIPTLLNELYFLFVLFILYNCAFIFWVPVVLKPNICHSLLSVVVTSGDVSVIIDVFHFVFVVVVIAFEVYGCHPI